MNPFCPYDNTLLKTTHTHFKCPYCNSSWKKGAIIMRHRIIDPVLFIRRLFK